MILFPKNVIHYFEGKNIFAKKKETPLIQEASVLRCYLRRGYTFINNIFSKFNNFWGQVLILKFRGIEIMEKDGKMRSSRIRKANPQDDG